MSPTNYANSLICDHNAQNFSGCKSLIIFFIPTVTVIKIT